MPKTVVEFYATEDGKSPVRKFIDRSTSRQQVKVLRLLQYLEEFGLTPAVPNTKKLRGTPFWELRVLGKDNIRILCAPLGRGKIAVLHIFLKKKRRTPRKEIDTALRRYYLLQRANCKEPRT